jgi:HEAT repeat protein
MSVNLKKVAQDLLCPDQEVRILALTTVVQLTMASLEAPEELPLLWDALEQASQIEDSDTIFLARKGLNHLQSLMQQGGSEEEAEVPRSRPSLPPLVREEVLERLQRAGDDPHSLANLLADLSRVGPLPEDVALVSPFLKSPEARVRANAVEVIEATEDAELMLKFLSPLLEDENHRVQANANKALGRLGRPEVLATLSHMSRSGNLAEREAGVYAMSFLKGDEVFEFLLLALKDPYEGIRLRAVKALGRLKDPRAIPPLRAMLNDIDIDVCEEADRVLRYISMESPQPDREGFHQRGEGTQGRPEPVLSPEQQELQAARENLLSGFGQQVYLLLRKAEIPDAGLRRPFYDVVKAQEFLHKQQGRVAGGELLDFDAEKTRKKIEKTLRSSLLDLAMRALEAGASVPGFEEVRVQLKEFDEQLKDAG